MNTLGKKFLSTAVMGILLAIVMSAQTITTKNVETKIQTTYAKFVGKTPELRHLVPRAPTSPERKAQNKLRRPPRNFIGRGRPFSTLPDALPKNGDAVRQLNLKNNGFAINPKVNMNGLTIGSAPHDPSGDIGKDYYIQITNITSFQIFNKDGSAASDPIAANTLWSSIGFSSAGDPIVLYDQEMQRWIITEFPNGNQLLFAISETSDPFGSWMAYNFATPIFPDYPKYSIWNDSYVVTTNENGASGLTAYFIDREQMLMGADNVPIQRLEFPGFPPDSAPSFFAATPVDWSGNTPPAADTKPMVLRLSDDAWGASAQDQIDIISVEVDYDDPDNTSTTITSVVVSPFDSDPCAAPGFGFACAPQLGGGGVDAIPFVIMNQAHYQNFGSHESMVLNFVVNAADGEIVAGIRWMELRKSAGEDWSLYQEGTYAPEDGLHRYMGAIAQDAAGNIALAFSASSENDYIGLRLTGRRAGDPLGEMTAEELLLVPGGSTNNDGRYGDYAQMSVDPINGKTFWYTSEYPGPEQIDTRIVAFDLTRDTIDIGPLALLTPQSAADLTATEPVEIQVKNFGIDTQMVFNVGYIFENQPAVIEPVNFVLAPDSIYTHTFVPTVDMSAIGDYEFRIFTDLMGDDAPFNDTLRIVRSQIPRYDAGVTAIGGPDGLICGSELPIQLTLQNFGFLSLTTATIDVSLNGTPFTTINWTGDLAFGESTIVDVTLTGLVDGNNTVAARVSQPNGETDEVMANDLSSRDFTALLNGEEFTLSVTTDFYPDEISWQVLDSVENVVASGGPYGEIFSTIEESICLDPNQCYTLFFMDSYGDGIPDGGYTLSNSNGEVLVTSDGQFGFGEQNEFCGSAVCLLEVDIDVSPVSSDVDDGIIMVSLSNTGGSTFLVSIDGGMTFSSATTFSGLAAGTYDIVVTNNEGCDYQETVELAACSLSAMAEVTNVVGDNLGAIQVNVTAGNPPYSYSLDGENFQTESLFIDLMAGDYTVFIRDDLGCTIELMATVDIETSVHTTTFGQMITVFPNPSEGVFRVNLEGLQRGDVFLPIQIYNNAGQLVQASQLVRYDQAYTGQISLVAEPDGVYFIRFLDDQIDRMLQVVKQ